MDTVTAVQVCPLCGESKYMIKKTKMLYGQPVCKKCYNAFGNRRQLAFVVDMLLWNICLVVVLGVLGLLEDSAQGLVYLLFPIFCLKDGFSGSSPGKRIMGVQAVDKTTFKPIGFKSSFKRNLPLIIPFVPLIVAFDLLHGYRIGDGWANSRVIWKKYKDSPLFTNSSAGVSAA